MYKNVAQNTSVASVEVVIQKFLDHSRSKLTEALAKVDELEGPAEKAQKEEGAADVEDLEASETPESILLSTVSEEKSRDRTYRTLVTPWLRFLWEAYRTALDILRNNARLETLYQVSFARCVIPVNRQLIAQFAPDRLPRCVRILPDAPAQDRVPPSVRDIAIAPHLVAKVLATDALDQLE